MILLISPLQYSWGLLLAPSPSTSPYLSYHVDKPDARVETTQATVWNEYVLPTETTKHSNNVIITLYNYNSAFGIKVLQIDASLMKPAALPNIHIL